MFCSPLLQFCIFKNRSMRLASFTKKEAFKLLHVSAVGSFLLLCRIPSYGVFTSKLPFGLFPVFDNYEESCYTHSCISFWGNRVIFLLPKYLNLGFLGHMLSVFLTLQETAKLLSKVATQFCITISNVSEFQLLHILVSFTKSHSFWF